MMTFSLRPDEPVLGAVDGGLGQHAGGLLEGGRREEAAGVERRLGDAQQHGLRGGRLAALGQDLVVDLLELELVDELEGQLLGVARLVDAHLAQHLPDDDLDVLVVDGHALAAVHALDLLDEVALDRLPAAGLEVFLRVDGAVGDRHHRRGSPGRSRPAAWRCGGWRTRAPPRPRCGRAGPARSRTIRPRSGARTSSIDLPSCSLARQRPGSTSTMSPSATSSSWPFGDPQRHVERLAAGDLDAPSAVLASG